MILRLFHARRIRKARQAREDADRALMLAVWSDDPEAIEDAQKRMREATHYLMRLEMG